MRSCGLSALFSLLLAAEVKLLAAEVTPSVPAGWKVIKDSKGACQIAVPADWTPSENPGSAAFQDATIAVVTNQPGQTLKPLSESMQKILAIAKVDHDSSQTLKWRKNISLSAVSRDAHPTALHEKFRIHWPCIF